MTSVGVMSSNLVTVRCTDHDKYVAVALRNLFDTKRGADFDLRCDGRTLRAHRVILELFLAPQTIGSNVVHPEVKQEVSDYDCGSSYSVLDSLIEFLYKGEVAVPKNELLELLKVAREMEFQILEDAIVQSSNFKVMETENRLDFKVVQEGECSEDARETETAFQDESSPYEVDVLVVYDSNMSTGGSNSPLAGFPEPKMELNLLYDKANGNYEFDSRLGIFEVENGKSEPEEASMITHCGLDEESSLDFVSGSDNGGALLEESAHPGVGGNFLSGGSKTCSLNLRRKCPHCEFVALQYSLYHNHLLLVHGLTPCGRPAKSGPPQPSVKAYVCPQCNYKSNLKANLKKHLSVVHGVGYCQYTCKTCGKRCGSRIHLIEHNFTHTNELPYKCPHCSYGSKHHSNLRRHVRQVHSEVNRIMC